MSILIIVATLLTVVIVHEAAHALAMRRLGVHIEEAGIGLPIPPVLRINTWWGWRLSLSPWLVGAYVSATKKDTEYLDQLPYRQRAWYLNAGIVANLLLGFAAVAAHGLINGYWPLVLASAGFGIGVWISRHQLAAYVIPFAAIPALASVVAGLVLSWTQGKTGMGFADFGDIAPATAAGIPSFVALISFAVAWLNMLPLFGLDNGRVIEAALAGRLPKRVMSAYRGIGIGLVLLSIVGAVASDLWAIVTAAL
ncbi:M50 family metallopeptidase [Catelliglobosispora koreensis]|uniref:M50 family metallopeptidase n=1 Tax=Catelliglobosispora koreensis TaxID=129052 RepID=UPI00037F9A3A|nr:M50 family metallopeptidase [Catelliglobosispora koreensis]